MNDDERAIRELVTTWMAATQAGDVDKVLSFTLLTKQGGRWVIARDANLLAPVDGPQP